MNTFYTQVNSIPESLIKLDIDRYSESFLHHILGSYDGSFAIEKEVLNENSELIGYETIGYFVYCEEEKELYVSENMKEKFSARLGIKAQWFGNGHKLQYGNY